MIAHLWEGIWEIETILGAKKVNKIGHAVSITIKPQDKLK